MADDRERTGTTTEAGGTSREGISLPARIGLSGVVALAYVVLFLFLHGSFGVGASALVLLPVVVIGWLLGAWGGLLAGLAALPLNAFLLDRIGEPGWLTLDDPSSLEGPALVVVVGAVVGLLRDLGRRLERQLREWRETEEALRDSEVRYRDLFLESRAAIYVADGEGRILDANPAALELLGYRRDELVGRSVAGIYAGREAWERIRRDTEELGSTEMHDVPVQTREGAVLRCRVTSTIRRSGSGDTIGYQGIVMEKGEEDEAEELIRRRTRKLQEAVSDLEAFAYSVSHDLRAPLVTIEGFATALDEDHGEELPPAGRDKLRRIVRASEHMEQLLSGLLAYSRVGREEIEIGKVELREVVDTARQHLSGMLDERDVDLRLEGPFPEVMGHRATLVQVVENLLSNAVKFVPGERRPEVTISGEERDGHFRLAVDDNGPGIDPEEEERIFRVFERGSAPGEVPGSGIGLAVVEKGIDRLGGRVGFEPLDDGGTRFWFELPLPR